jgi:CPA2 family monovalent cation:H+ antiporter-2
MNHLPPLITDLALILACAGVVTLLFKRMKQPLVLGYIVAGFITSPHLQYTPSVVDTSSIHTWADIGVLFLLFALGLEFSFKKLIRIGGTAFVAAGVIMISMSLLGVFVGHAFVWPKMSCIFLGGMLAMSSTTIIYKAFEDLKLRQQNFARVVLSILIVEDILAIVLMVMLSTMAASRAFEGMEMMYSVFKLFFFLVLWFVVGIFILPSFLKRSRKWMGNETLLIVSLALCFSMVLLAVYVGYSAAFGAFIMGSILAETIEAEQISSIIKPVKDLFGAIFFVSVGMMVDPSMIVEYAWPIAIITLVVILGQSFFGTLGVLLAGEPLKTAVRSGFSLTQIGEFAFIIASLGVTLGVTAPFLYPIVVAVSVITTFITPYMMRVSPWVVKGVERALPERWLMVLNRYSEGTSTMNHEGNWRKLLFSITRIVLVYAVLCIAIIILSKQFLMPFVYQYLPNFWGALLGTGITLLIMAPFLRAMVMKKNRSREFRSLWVDSRFNRAPLVSTIVIRFMLAGAFVIFVIGTQLQISLALIVLLAIVIVSAIIYSRWIKHHSILMERKFFRNLRFRDWHLQKASDASKPNYANKLLSRDLHLSDVILPADSSWAGMTIGNLDLGQKYGIHIASIVRGELYINIPDATTRLFPNDKLQVIGTDEQLEAFVEFLQEQSTTDWNEEHEEMCLHHLVVDEKSCLLGKTIRNAGIRERYRCLVVGIDKGEGLLSPDVDVPFEEGDILWVVGEQTDVYALLDKPL